LEGFNTEYQTTLEEYQSYGVSEATFRSAYKNELLRKKLAEAITADVQSTEEQVWARHILVVTESEAKAVIELLNNGSDFEKLAKQFSTDTGSGAVGGDLGWFGRGAMVPEFENAAFSQPIGEISEPVQSQFGYHIIQVLDRQELPLDASQLQQSRDNAFTEWLTTAKEEADVTTNDLWMQHIPEMPHFGA
jgi:foldase protein PrsA